MLALHKYIIGIRGEGGNFLVVVEYLSEDGRKRPKHVGRLPHFPVLLCLIIVLLEYVWRFVLLRRIWIIVMKLC